MIISYLYILSSNLSFAFFGAVFWFIVAKLYTPGDVGLGSALISLSSFLVFLSSIGIGPALIRFIPEEDDRENLVTSILWFSIIFCFVISLIFIMGIHIFFSEMYFLKEPIVGIIFIFFTLVLLIFTLFDSLYISFKQTKLVLIKNLIQGFLKVLLIFLFPFSGGFWIFSCNCLPAILAIIITVPAFLRKAENIRFKFFISFQLIKKLFSFALVNYIGSFSLILPGIILPLFIFANFSKEYAGYFYISWMIFMVYASFITAGMSIFLMEGSHEGLNISLIRKVVLISFLLIAIGLVGIFLLGDRVLLFFGQEYVKNASSVIKILFSSLPFFGINQLFLAIKNIKKDITAVAILNIIIIFSLIISSFCFRDKGFEAGAFGWLISQIMGVIVISVIILKKE